MFIIMHGFSSIVSIFGLKNDHFSPARGMVTVRRRTKFCPNHHERLGSLRGIDCLTLSIFPTFLDKVDRESAMLPTAGFDPLLSQYLINESTKLEFGLGIFLVLFEVKICTRWSA